MLKPKFASKLGQKCISDNVLQFVLYSVRSGARPVARLYSETSFEDVSDVLTSLGSREIRLEILLSVEYASCILILY